MILYCLYIDGSQVEDAIDQGWNIVYLKKYQVDRMCFLATKEIEK